MAADDVRAQSGLSVDDEIREAAVQASLRSFRRHFHWVLPEFVRSFGIQCEPRLQALAEEHVRIAMAKADLLTAKLIADTFHLRLTEGAEQLVETARTQMLAQLKAASVIVVDGTRPATNKAPAHVGPPLRFYVASTFEDLKEYRSIAADRIHGVGHEAELAEAFGDVAPREVAAACRSIVRSCDACVLILGSRRGSGPDDEIGDRLSTPSFTMLEFREALAADLPVLAYFLDDRALGRPVSAERGNAQDPFIVEFRREIMDGARVRHISLDAQFEFRLGFDVVDLGEAHGRAPRMSGGRRAWTNDTLFDVLGPLGPLFVATALVREGGWEVKDRLSLLNGYPEDTSQQVFRRADNHNDAGWEHHERGDYAKALGEYEQALAVCRDFPVVWNNKGLAHYRLGDFRRAEDAFMEAIRLRPEFVKPWSNMGVLYWELKQDAPAARRWLCRALGLDPADHRAKEYLRDIADR